MSKFTKGKWIIDRDGSAIFSDSEDCYVAELSPANSDEQVAANARLITAAPEMYELLYEALQELKGYDPIGNGISTIYPYIEELLARIDGKEV